MKKVTYVPENVQFVVDSYSSDWAVNIAMLAYLQGVSEWQYHTTTPEKADIRNKENYKVSDLSLADLGGMFEKYTYEGPVGDCLMFA